MYKEYSPCNILSPYIDKYWEYKGLPEYGTKINIFARPFATNMGSQRVLEKAGFELEARLKKTLYKNGELMDELIYVKFKL